MKYKTIKKTPYRGIKVDIDPKPTEVKMLITSETLESYSEGRSPLFLFIYNDEMYFGICDYILDIFQYNVDLDDNFSYLFPTTHEFNILSKYTPTYYKLDYVETMKGDLDYFSDFELDLLKKSYRDIQLNKLIKNGN